MKGWKRQETDRFSAKCASDMEGWQEGRINQDNGDNTETQGSTGNGREDGRGQEEGG